jgi:hypothetical protein
MNDFNRKVEEASSRLNQSVRELVDLLEKHTAEMAKYVNDEVVPVVRAQSTDALRTASVKLAELADYMEKNTPRKP